MPSRRLPRRTVLAFTGLLSLAVPAFAQSTLDRFAGAYSEAAEPEVVYSIFAAGDHLTLETPRSAAVTLVPAGGDAFTAPGGMRYEFALSGDRATAMHWVHSVRGVATPADAERVGEAPQHNHFRPYARQDVMIPMRDGVKLHAAILRPTDTNEPLPFMMQRTPYGVEGYVPDRMNSQFTELAQSGYIFVMEDIRGRYQSEGKFVMMRPIAAHHDPNSHDTKNTDESTDTYDTVAWILKNIPNNNGRVGVAGVSYPGFLAAEAGIDPHPAVKAISPQAPMTDVWMGDDFFHNGAFRQTYGYDYVLGMESSKEATFQPMKEDAYDYFLKAGSFEAAGKAGVDDLPTGKAFLEHPSYDDFWQTRAVQPHLDRVMVPTLEVGGWWDQEDMWGPQEEYAALKPHDAKGEVYIALGPWNHGQWTLTTRKLGAIDFGSATGDWFRTHIEAPFFAHYLKDAPGFDAKSAISFQTGSNTWKQYPVWPPKQGIEEKDLYLAADHALSFAKPVSDAAFTAYTSDPASPVHYRKRPIEATYAPTGSHWYTWLVENQKPYETRSDVATWKTPALDHDVTITGDVLADIVASTSGTDSDWVVKLIDENPDDASLGKMAGYQLMIVDEIFRGRYRTSYEHPEATPANQPEEYKFSLHGADHVFKQGHRIVVQVQSSWFPLYDRNPQTFVPNIMKAKASDFKAAEQHIYASSHIVLPVAE